MARNPAVLLSVCSYVVEKTVWTLTSINKLLKSTKLVYELKQVEKVA
jgi:hypothetical protein